MIKASLETRRFYFEAYGKTLPQAYTALTDGLAIHAKEYNLPADWFVIEDIRLDSITCGRCYRDGSELK